MTPPRPRWMLKLPHLLNRLPSKRKPKLKLVRRPPDWKKRSPTPTTQPSSPRAFVAQEKPPLRSSQIWANKPLLSARGCSREQLLSRRRKRMPISSDSPPKVRLTRVSKKLDGQPLTRHKPSLTKAIRTWLTTKSSPESTRET
jgi:hypothetical protein